MAAVKPAGPEPTMTRRVSTTGPDGETVGTGSGEDRIVKLSPAKGLGLGEAESLIALEFERGAHKIKL